MAERIPGVRATDSALDRRLWPRLRHYLGARLAHDLLPTGSATRIADEWLRVDSSNVPAARRIDALVDFCAASGADARAVVERLRDRLSREAAPIARREGRRARLESRPWTTASEGDRREPGIDTTEGS